MDHPLTECPKHNLSLIHILPSNAICSKSAAKILALVAVVIGVGPEVNSAAHRLPGLCFHPCTRAERALNEAARACACRAREAKTYQDQAIEISRFRDQETGDNRTAQAVGQRFPASTRPGQTGPQYGFMECSSQEAGHRSGTHPGSKGCARVAAKGLLC